VEKCGNPYKNSGIKKVGSKHHQRPKLSQNNIKDVPRPIFQLRSAGKIIKEAAARSGSINRSKVNSASMLHTFTIRQ